MDHTTEPNLKMRFRLPNGEEFEAEGTREFIESQRNYFLNLIGKTQVTTVTAEQPVSTVHSTPPLQALPNAAAPVSTEQTKYAELRLWERVFKEEGNTLILRKKAKLPVPDAALLLIAAARALLSKESYSALELAKSLKANALLTTGRLDRVLAAEIQAGRLTAQGSKRGRSYSLSPEGAARAFVLAEKLSQN